MHIKVLGPGCSNCRTLEKQVYSVLTEMDLTADVERVVDFREIMEYGVFRTPGLVINDQVVLSGRLPSPAELKLIIRKFLE